MAGHFPRKRLLIRSTNKDIQHNTSADAEVTRVKNLINSIKTQVNAKNMDAPDFSRAVYLGKVCDQESPIWKVNVSGWIYKFEPNWNTATRTTADIAHGDAHYGVLLSSDPHFLTDNSDKQKANRILYMTAWDGEAYSQANPMFPINPGASTYMTITRDPSVVNEDERAKELWFVPTMLPYWMNIHKDDYITKVGYSIPDLEVADIQPSFVGNSVVSLLWDGWWADKHATNLGYRNFAAVRGYMRVRRDMVIFLDNVLSIQFGNTHPVTQLSNDGYNYRNGLLLVEINLATLINNWGGTIFTAMNKVSSYKFSSKPWNVIPKGRSIVQDNVPHLKGNAVLFTMSDGSQWWGGNYAGVAVFTSIWMDSGVTYKFEQWFDDWIQLSIDGAPIGSSSYSYSSSVSHTATRTGWHDLTIVASDFAKVPFGGICTVSTTNRKQILGQSAEEWNKLELEVTKSNVEKGLKLIIPTQVTDNEYKELDRR